MIRTPFGSLVGERFFRWRGGDVSRLEGLSDGVFAFAVTLLVVSLSVPGTFDELLHALSGLPVFAVCFVLLLYVWYSHFLFHRRYGLENALTTWMNGALLFLVLAYVYPLKWMFRFLAALVTGEWRLLDESGAPVLGSDGQPLVIIQGTQVPVLLQLYSGGFAAIFLLLLLMTLYARSHARELELSRTELLVTDASLWSHGLSVAFGLTSVAIATFLPGRVAWAGMVYFAMGPLHGLNGWLWGRRIERSFQLEHVAAPEGERAGSPGG